MCAKMTRQGAALLICLWLASYGTRAVPLPDDPPPTGNVDKNPANSPSSQPNDPPKSNPANSNNPNAAKEETPESEGEGKAPVLPLYLQMIPAICMVFLFALGIVIIISVQRAEDRNKKKEDVAPLEDEHFGTMWVSQLKQVRKKSSILERLKSPAVLVLGDRQKKYELYESMLEKYREDIAIKRQMFRKQSPLTARGSSKRLKELAMMHRTKSESGDHSDDPKTPLWQQELQAMEEEDDSTAEGAQSTRTLTTPLTDSTPPPDSIPPTIMNYPPSSTQITIRTSLVSSSEEDTPDKLSYYQDYNEEKVSFTPLIQLHTASTSSESADTCPLIMRGETPPLAEPGSRRPPTKPRARPKSWMASISSAAVRGKKALTRPRSLLVSQQAIDEGPELAPLDFDSLHNYKFEHESEKDMNKMITAVEQQMVKDVFASKQDLTGSEIDALEKLLDDVSRFCKDYCSTDWGTRKQYSLDTVYEHQDESAVEKGLKHQQSLPSVLFKRSLSDSIRKIHDSVKMGSGYRTIELEEVPLLDLSEMSPHIERSEEVENLLTAAEPDKKGIVRSPEVEDLLYASDFSSVHSTQESLTEGAVYRLTSYEDDVFMTDSEADRDAGSPLDVFAAFQQYPKPYIKVKVEDAENPAEATQVTFEESQDYGTTYTSPLEEKMQSSSDGPLEKKSHKHRRALRRRSSFEYLVDDLFEFGSCSSEASGSGRDEPSKKVTKMEEKDSSDSSDGERLQRDSVVFEGIIDNNLKTLEILPSMESELQLADTEAHLEEPLIPIIAKPVLYASSSDEDIPKEKNTEPALKVASHRVEVSSWKTQKEFSDSRDDPSCQFEKDIEAAPKIHFTSKKRPSLITITSKRADSAQSESRDSVSTREGSSMSDDGDCARTPSPSDPPSDQTPTQS